MDIGSFRASGHTATNDEMALILRDLDFEFPLEAEEWRVYADGFCLHRVASTWFVHAWWQKPVGWSSLDLAESALLDWCTEFH